MVVSIVVVLHQAPRRVTGGGPCLAGQRFRLKALPSDGGFADFLPRVAIPIDFQLGSSLPTHSVVNYGIVTCVGHEKINLQECLPS